MVIGIGESFVVVRGRYCRAGLTLRPTTAVRIFGGVSGGGGGGSGHFCGYFLILFLHHHLPLVGGCSTANGVAWKALRFSFFERWGSGFGEDGFDDGRGRA